MSTTATAAVPPRGTAEPHAGPLALDRSTPAGSLFVLTLPSESDGDAV